MCKNDTNKTKGRVYWITGLSGAGKSTLAARLARHLRNQGRPVVVLDGDELREALGREAAHACAERLALAMSYARLCRLLANQGLDVVVATISLFHQVHEWNRSNLAAYLEILLEVPMEELCQRDPKRLYERVTRGEIASVAGFDLAVEMPKAPHIVLQQRDGLSAEATFFALLQSLESLGLPGIQVQGKHVPA
jgi:adenylylsulfate kinase